jgi:hypothetical protein
MSFQGETRRPIIDMASASGRQGLLGRDYSVMVLELPAGTVQAIIP